MTPVINPYQQTQITTASPEQLLIMLYDGALRFLGQARQSLEAGQQLPKREAVSKAMSIISYLADTLDHQAGWDHSEELDGLYGFMLRELTKVNLANDPAALTVVEDLLTGLRDTWGEAITLVRQEKVGIAAAPAGATETYQAFSVAL